MCASATSTLTRQEMADLQVFSVLASTENAQAERHRADAPIDSTLAVPLGALDRALCYVRIVGELRKLGIAVSATLVRHVLARAGIPPARLMSDGATSSAACSANTKPRREDGVCAPHEVWSLPDLGLVRRREGTAFAEASLNGGIRSGNATQTSDFEHNSLRDGALCGPPSSGQQAKEAGCRGGPYGA